MGDGDASVFTGFYKGVLIGRIVSVSGLSATRARPLECGLGMQVAGLRGNRKLEFEMSIPGILYMIDATLTKPREQE